MITRTPDATAPYFDVADPAFCVTSAEVRRAREAGWYARTSYGLAVLARADMATALTVLAGRLADPRPAGEAVWLPDSGNTGPVRLPISFTRRPA
jgi:hypothetical protein